MKTKIAARDSTWKIERGGRRGSQSQPGLMEPLLQSTNVAQVQDGRQLLVTFWHSF